MLINTKTYRNTLLLPRDQHVIAIALHQLAEVTNEAGDTDYTTDARRLLDRLEFAVQDVAPEIPYDPGMVVTSSTPEPAPMPMDEAHVAPSDVETVPMDTDTPTPDPTPQNDEDQAGSSDTPDMPVDPVSIERDDGVTFFVGQKVQHAGTGVLAEIASIDVESKLVELDLYEAAGQPVEGKQGSYLDHIEPLLEEEDGDTGEAEELGESQPEVPPTGSAVIGNDRSPVETAANELERDGAWEGDHTAAEEAVNAAEARAAEGGDEDPFDS